jgi:DnaJ-class molecular chaperone
MDYMNERTIKPNEAVPELYAQICPNCNGRGTVGLNPVRPCPTCGATDHKGIVYVPMRRNEGKYEKTNFKE